MRKTHFNIVIPEGTEVLTRREGRVGVVSHTPGALEHFVPCRFSRRYGGELQAIRLHHLQARPGGDPRRSTEYGLSHEASDVDRRDFYLPPADLEWSFAGVPEQLETITKRRLGDRAVHPASVESES
jgi:hypothetical protein